MGTFLQNQHIVHTLSSNELRLYFPMYFSPSIAIQAMLIRFPHDFNQFCLTYSHWPRFSRHKNCGFVGTGHENCPNLVRTEISAIGNDYNAIQHNQLSESISASKFVFEWEGGEREGDIASVLGFFEITANT